MKVLFLCSGGSSHRSQIAATILQRLNPSIEVFSLGIEKLTYPDQMVFELMEEFGFELTVNSTQMANSYNTETFDYLITIYNMATEKLPALSIHYVHKLHLDFDDPEKTTGDSITRSDAYRRLIDEIQTELDYFYHHMLKANPMV